MSFNPDVYKQAQEVIFLIKRLSEIALLHLLIMCLLKELFQNHDLFLDEKLNLLEHIDGKIKKVKISIYYES